MRKVQTIDTDWFFTKNPGEIPDRVPGDGGSWEAVNLPHTWNAVDGQDGKNDYYRGRCRYVRELARRDLPQGSRYFLQFDGANSSADVYVNGKHCGHHDGGYSAWRVDITQLLADENLITVDVDNSPNDTVYPQQADFTFYGGLYRDVKLIAVPESHFDLEYFGGPGVRAVTEVEAAPDPDGGHVTGKLSVTAYVKNLKNGQSVCVALLDQTAAAAEVLLPSSAFTVNERGIWQAETQIAVQDVHLWNGRKDPHLYTVKTRLLGKGETLDEVSLACGFRGYEINPQKGFILNGESYPLRGVSRHQDRKGIGNALLPEHHREDMDLICEVGANTIRLAHYQHSAYFYDLCDERGMCVWAEIPYISRHMPKGRANTLSQMTELIVQNIHRPSIVVWGLSNEITMGGDTDPDLLDNHRELNALVHRLDPTRKTTMACVTALDIHSPILRIPDVVSYNHYFGWYGGDTAMNGPWFDQFHETNPDIPIGISEYGCEGLNWHSSMPRQGDYTEEYQAHYHEELIRQIAARPWLWATHVWNMFDFGADARAEGGEPGQNHKGLVTFDRKYKKDAFYAYKAWWSDEKFVHICGKRYADRAEDTTKVTVYSNLPEVTLYVNGKERETKRAEDHFFYFEVPLDGTITLRAAARDAAGETFEDESRIRRVSNFNEAYRLKESGALLSWYEITAPDGYFSLNDTIGDITATEEGARLFDALMGTLGGAKMAGFTIDDSMRKMMNGFTVIRMLNMLSTMTDSVTREMLLSLNSRLNAIPKP